MELCIFTEPQQGASYDDQLAQAAATERLGFDGWFRSDHFLAMGDTDPLPGPTDAWTTLAGLARDTRRIRLGTLVSSATFRHPSILAIQVAQVDAMSGGRVELGLGTGWFAEEHEAYGIPFPPKRFGLFEEQLEIVTGLWSTPVGERFDFSGEHYTLRDAPALPKPVQDRGARDHRRRRTEAHAGARGSIRDRVQHRLPLGGRRRRDVRRRATRLRADRARPATMRTTVALPTVVATDDADYLRRLAAIGADADTFAEVNIAGTPEAAVEKLLRLRDLGADRVYLQLVDLRDLDHLELIAAEVLPHLR